MEQDYLNKTVTSQGRKRGEDGNSEVGGAGKTFMKARAVSGDTKRKRTSPLTLDIGAGLRKTGWVLHISKTHK